MAGKYTLPGGQRFHGRFERGLAAAGSKGTWADRSGGRFAVVLRRPVQPWDLRDSEDVFASITMMKA